MVTVEHVESRADLAEAMTNLRAETAVLLRRGHEGKHQSCRECDRMAALHLNLDVLLTSWLDTEA